MLLGMGLASTVERKLTYGAHPMQLKQFFLATSLTLISLSSHAGLLISGTFAIDFGFFGVPTQGEPILAGSYTATFDDSIVLGTGNEAFRGLSFDSFLLTSGPVGSTTFNLSNTVFDLEFEDGVLDYIRIGGSTDGTASPVATIGQTVDDFRVDNFDPGLSSAVRGWVSAASTPLSDFSTLGTATFALQGVGDNPPSLVPVPGTLLLLCVGTIVLLRRQMTAALGRARVTYFGRTATATRS